MPAWADVRKAVPELAAAVEAAFDAHKHKTLATLRRDGSPRLSGTELSFTDESVWFGVMPGARRLDDLERDPRLALHSAPCDETLALGDAKLSGRAVAVTEVARFQRLIGSDDATVSFPMFEVDVSEIALVRLGGDPPDHLVVESWRPRRGYRREERR